MPEPIYKGVPLGKLINTPIYANGNTYGYDYTYNNVKYNFKNGSYIGVLYSWTTDNKGNVYMMFYIKPEDYSMFEATYVPLNNKINAPDLPAIKDQIKQEQEQNKPLVQQYLDKYLPYIVGGIVVWLALPTITNELKNIKTKKIGATQSNSLLTLVLIGGAYYVISKQQKQINGINQPIIINKLPDSTMVVIG